MAEVFVDSNILLDVLTDDPHWAAASAALLRKHGQDHELIINAVVFAEVSIAFDRIEDIDAALAAAGIQVRPIPREAAFLAGKCFVKYRRAGGPRRSPLPDFFIGAHAAIERTPLITRDKRRYRGYFPQLVLVAPE